jgi:hypothetical protein
MEAFQLRLWDGRIGRWLSPDPYGQHSSPYLGMGNNPTGTIDPDGGYSWFGAAWRYAAGGFKGDFHKSTNEKWGWGTTYENTSFNPEGGGVGIITHHDFGQGRVNSNSSSSNWNWQYKDPFPNWNWNWFKDHSSGDPLWGNGRDGGGDDRKIGKFGENYGGIDVTNMTSSVGVSPTKNVALELGRRGVEFWDYYNNIKEKVVEPLLSEGVKKDTFYYVNFTYKTHTFGVKHLKGQKKIDSVKLQNPKYSTTILDVKIK